MPPKVARSKSNRKPNRSRAAKNSTQGLRLWIGLAILCGLGLVAFVLLLRLLLPVLLLTGLVALGYWIWRTVHRQQQQQRRRQTRLNTQFYQLLKRQQGRISALDFAMFTQTDGIVAQNYLNEQAQAFSTYCETTIQGDIIYVFNLAAIDQPTHHETAQAAWAEQARSQRAQVESTQAALISAQQMRSLRQPSQKKTTEKPIIPLPAPPDQYRDLRAEVRSPIAPKLQPKQIKPASPASTPTAPMPAESTGAQRRKSAQLPLSKSHRRTLRNDQAVVTIDVSAVRS
ncbi:MAG: hypothetical protein DCF25_01280 [Leptolyngbya foveolarum]|uniref:Uncharacterized protein n=1 Tax=Leptolyngbya foveolarum TaxID=47253 RepID=A0A2W4URH7_9CYAN|nr:MAG: hypothetical protein DCF25_01280 [Leptolyngbya foveolarum]